MLRNCNNLEPPIKFTFAVQNEQGGEKNDGVEKEGTEGAIFRWNENSDGNSSKASAT